MCNLHGTTTRKDIYVNLLKALTGFSLSLENMSGLCRDGASVMTNWIIAQIASQVEYTGRICR